MEDKEISQEDVKKEFEELQTKQAEATEETSTEETEASESTSDVVKPVTEETNEVEPKVIPYNRFKEVNDKVKAFEDLQKEAENLIERGPDGRLRIKVVEKTPAEEVGLELTEEEQLALDSVQSSVVSKIIQREFMQRERQAENTRLYREESSNWWNKAQEEFPEVKNRESDLYKRADKIFREQYVTFGKKKGEWTAPANAHYLSCLQAEKELSREKVKTSQAKIEESKNKKQQVFVEKKSGQVQAKKKVDDKEFENFSNSEQEAAMLEQWNESHSEE